MCESKNLCVIFIKVLSGFGWNWIIMLLRLVGLMNLKLILSYLISIQGREPSLDGFIKQTLTLACICLLAD